MKKILLIMLALCVIVFAKTITGESSYTFGESESIIQAKKTCKQLAIKNAVESFATYIESESVIRDFVTEKDVIVARSLALVRDVEVLEEKMDLANMSIFYKIKGEINEQEVIDALKQKSADGTIDEIKRSGLYYFGEADNANAREA
ncbi:MAG: hypothetical protein JXN63_08440, partial [Candidatus Delongbacteria bacterium]|nr:hypothetical protein [Candidatus Delongbacteria bacterium]